MHGERGDGASVDESKLPYSRTGLAPWYGDDWLHANAVIHSVDAEGNDFFWMSLRHQDWVIRSTRRVERSGGALGIRGTSSW